MTQDKKEISQTPKLILEQMFVNLNNLKEALDAQASNDAKIEPVVLPPPNPLPLPIPPLDEKRIDTNKKSSKHWDER
jgi:hypothetical protein